MDTRAAPPDSTDIARRANAQIAEMAERLDSIVKNPRPIGFLCECGCLGIIELTLAEFRASGEVRIAEHR
jgi:hypothetical protein